MADQVVQLPDWELYIFRLAREILEEQSPSKLLQAREMMYELLSNCIPGDVIIKTLTNELMKVCMYVCMCMCVCKYVCTCVCVYVSMYVCAYVCAFERSCVMCAYAHVCICVHVYV